MAKKKRSGSAATNSVSVGGSAPGAPNTGIGLPGFNVGAKISSKSRKSKGGKSTMKLANGARSGIMNPPQQGGYS